MGRLARRPPGRSPWTNKTTPDRVQKRLRKQSPPNRWSKGTIRPRAQNLSRHCPDRRANRRVFKGWRHSSLPGRRQILDRRHWRTTRLQLPRKRPQTYALTQDLAAEVFPPFLSTFFHVDLRGS